MEMASRLGTLRETDWFKSRVGLLNTFRQKDGTWQFPRTFLLEKKNKYWLYSGGHMGLGEDRKKRDALRIESTFRMLRIMKSMKEVIS